jgi:hypothetical protein
LTDRRVEDANDDDGERVDNLSTETIEGTALALEGVDNVEGCDSLSLGVLGVGDGITDDALEEGLQNTTSLFVNHC